MTVLKFKWAGKDSRTVSQREARAEEFADTSHIPQWG